MSVGLKWVVIKLKDSSSIHKPDFQVMQTRRGFCYPSDPPPLSVAGKRSREEDGDAAGVANKRQRQKQRQKQRPMAVAVVGEKDDFMDGLPDDIVITILCKLSKTASRPSDLINVAITYVDKNGFFLLFFFDFEFLVVDRSRWEWVVQM